MTGKVNCALPDLEVLTSVGHRPLDGSTISGEIDTSGFLLALLQTSRDCLKVLTPDARVIFINRGGINALEADTTTKIVGQNWPSFWGDSYQPAICTAMEAARAGSPASFTGEAKTFKGNARFWQVTITPIFDSSQKVVQLLVASRDVSAAFVADRTIGELSQRARVGEMELKESEAKFQVITDAMPQMVWSTLPDGFHDFFNARWYEFTGVPAGSTDGEGWNELFHPHDQERASARWRHSLATGEPYEIEYRLRHHSGEYRWTLGRALPMRNESGDIIRWFGTCTEIHAAKMNAELLEMLSQELSHRIKNIFAIIQGMIGLSARKRPEMKDFGSELRERIAALGRAHDFARPHSDASRSDFEETTLKALLVEILKPYPAVDEGRLSFSGTDIAVDDKAATPIAMIIHELATNAMKYGAFSTNNGQISILVDTSDTHCHLVWSESGGPIIEYPPERHGFGTKLSTLAAESQLGGTLMREWLPTGLKVSIICPVAALRRR